MPQVTGRRKITGERERASEAARLPPPTSQTTIPCVMDRPGDVYLDHQPPDAWKKGTRGSQPHGPGSDGRALRGQQETRPRETTHAPPPGNLRYPGTAAHGGGHRCGGADDAPGGNRDGRRGSASDRPP